MKDIGLFCCKDKFVLRIRQVVAYNHKTLRAIILLVLLIITVIKAIGTGLKMRFERQVKFSFYY